MNLPLSNLPNAVPGMLLAAPDATALSPHERAVMLEAAAEVERCQHALAKAGLNVVGELLKGHEGFYEMNHYPDGDVFDRDSHSQYYYHAHREGGVEHGHFHTFIRGAGIGAHLLPRKDLCMSEPWPTGDEAIAHLVAVSMDAWGQPIGLFACNRWVTAETWYPATSVKEMLPGFLIDHAHPSWPTNLWLSAMLKLFRPHIEALLDHRDQVVEHWRALHPDQDVLEDRSLEITGHLDISIKAWVEQLRQAQGISR